MRAHALPDNVSVQGVRAGSELCGFAPTGARRAQLAARIIAGTLPRISSKKETAPILLACEQQMHFRSALLSLRKIAVFRRERGDDRKCVCCSQATILQSYQPL